MWSHHNQIKEDPCGLNMRNEQGKQVATKESCKYSDTYTLKKTSHMSCHLMYGFLAVYHLLYSLLKPHYIYTKRMQLQVDYLEVTVSNASTACVQLIVYSS